MLRFENYLTKLTFLGSSAPSLHCQIQNTFKSMNIWVNLSSDLNTRVGGRFAWQPTGY